MPEQEYEFRVSGLLSERAQHAVGDFCKMSVQAAPPETIIYGAVADRAQLRGILSYLEYLGLHLVSVQQVPDRSGSRAGPPSADE